RQSTPSTAGPLRTVNAPFVDGGSTAGSAGRTPVGDRSGGGGGVGGRQGDGHLEAAAGLGDRLQRAAMRVADRPDDGEAEAGATGSAVCTLRPIRSTSRPIAESALAVPTARSHSARRASRRPVWASLRASTSSASTSPLARSEASRTTVAIRRYSAESASSSL